MDLILDVSQVVNHTLVEMRILGELILIAGFCGVASGEGVLSWGEVATVDGVASAQLLWQSDEHLAGFQFECDAAAFLAAGGGEVEELGWQVYVEADMVLGFTWDPTTYIPPLGSPTHFITVDVPVNLGKLVLSAPVFATPEGAEIIVTGPGPLDLNADTCPGDVSGDGVVGVDDILDVLAFWGGGGGGDANGDGATDVDDILLVISAWGDC